jgi:hypothetical protein
VGLRDRLRRLQRVHEKQMIAIPQLDGSVKRFPESALADAFSNSMERLGAGEDAPPEHPLLEAARNSSDPKWAQSVYTSNTVVYRDGSVGAWTEPVEDLSEP